MRLAVMASWRIMLQTLESVNVSRIPTPAFQLQVSIKKFCICSLQAGHVPAIRVSGEVCSFTTLVLDLASALYPMKWNVRGAGSIYNNINLLFHFLTRVERTCLFLVATSRDLSSYNLNRRLRITLITSSAYENVSRNVTAQGSIVKAISKNDERSQVFLRVALWL